MPNGTVKFFNAAKGFGFITADTGGKDIFVPSASLTASGITALKPGQRLSFEEQPDGKGPKAVNLVLLAEALRPVAPKAPPPPPKAEARSRLVYYHDHTSEWSDHVLAEIREMGHEPVVVEYLEKAPTRDELKTLSRLLRSGNQSLVRRYEPLFLELRLDDRFIGDNEFWDAISENPALINGPLLATDAKASLCHTDESVETFFAPAPAIAEPPVAKPKGLSDRALRILAGDITPRAVEVETPAPARVEPAVPVAPAEKIEMPAKVSGKAAVKIAAKPAPKAAAKPVAKPKAAAKPKTDDKRKIAKPAKAAAKAVKRR